MKFGNKIIALIGMPGCGKSIIGKKVAEKLELQFIDLDNYIEENSGETIEEMFKKSEEYFRKFETKGIKELVNKNIKKSQVDDKISNSAENKGVFKSTPFVLSTGGGVVCNSYNMEILKNKCTIIFINRPVDDIAEDIDLKSRPLLNNGIERLYELYRSRYPLYIKYSDLVISNKNDINNAVDEIINSLDVKS